MKVKVFIVQHTNPETDDTKLIGVFDDRALAGQAISTLSDKSGFSKTIDGFHVDEISLNKIFWLDGYGIPSVDLREPKEEMSFSNADFWTTIDHCVNDDIEKQLACLTASLTSYPKKN